MIDELAREQSPIHCDFTKKCTRVKVTDDRRARKRAIADPLRFYGNQPLKSNINDVINKMMVEAMLQHYMVYAVFYIRNLAQDLVQKVS